MVLESPEPKIWFQSFLEQLRKKSSWGTEQAWLILYDQNFKTFGLREGNRPEWKLASVDIPREAKKFPP